MDTDPMVTGTAAERSAYRDNVKSIMLQTIEEDRANRRRASATPDAPATIVGVTGIGGALSEVAKT